MTYDIIFAPDAEQGLAKLYKSEPKAYQKALKLIQELHTPAQALASQNHYHFCHLLDLLVRGLNLYDSILVIVEHEGLSRAKHFRHALFRPTHLLAEHQVDIEP